MVLTMIKTAVKIARLNILVRFKNKNFIPNIFCKNTLFDIGNDDLFSFHDDKDIKDFDVIATNPPWGVHFSKAEVKKLKNLYPQISSFESFSYFLTKGLNLLRYSGVVSFILPESILNVRTHKDIRENYFKKRLKLKKLFISTAFLKMFFTPVIRLDLEKKITKK